MRVSGALALVALIVAPTFGPDLARAGAWTQPKGRLWVKVSGIFQESDEFFASQVAVLPDGRRVEAGDRRPYDDGGISDQRLVWSEAEYGVTDDLTLGLQVPYYDLAYEDNIQIIQSYGVGDVRLTGRYAILSEQHRLSARVAWKLPSGAAASDLMSIPIGDGQQDIELGLQYGASLGRALSWLGAEAGIRIRRMDEDRDWDPGNEWFWTLEAGYGLYRDGLVGAKVAYTATRGDETSVNFFSPAVDLSRDFDQLDVVLMVDPGWTFFELGWARTLGSETYPADSIFSLGVSRRFALFSRG